MRVTAEERAAKCWCQPTTERIVFDPILGEAVKAAITAAESAAREQALEEAAKVCDAHNLNRKDGISVAAHNLAIEIRALKDRTP